MAFLLKKEDTVRECIMLSLVLQFCFLPTAAMFLDGGQIFQIVGYATIAYWRGFALVFFRRGRGLIKMDKFLVK
jgi:hypothetical protein